MGHRCRAGLFLQYGAVEGLIWLEGNPEALHAGALQRYRVTGVASAPLVKWEEPDEESADPEGVRKAQGTTGALLWAVTRSRPDLSFVVSPGAVGHKGSKTGL